ncbi:hypothetical protein E2C01_100150 [Portunus trituberculatus]|uniref:Tudor domain-containing protein n=1 Tax=Portunus trituberculatus TaxID=210409 RepID=A0A5B7KH75_PORTR|nr:hypothetical protein [Portunus trituberculatus]
MTSSTYCSQRATQTGPFLQDTESETSLSDVMIPTSIASKVPKGWMVPPPPVDLAFIATPCNVDDEGHFFLQPKSMKATINLVMESQTLLFAGSIPGDQDLCWQPGDPVVARYHLDKKWYRATVDKASTWKKFDKC